MSALKNFSSPLVSQRWPGEGTSLVVGHRTKPTNQGGLHTRRRQTRRRRGHSKEGGDPIVEAGTPHLTPAGKSGHVVRYARSGKNSDHSVFVKLRPASLHAYASHEPARGSQSRI